MFQTLKHARQAKADLDHEIAKLKAEGRAIVAAPPETRTRAQSDRLDAIDAALVVQANKDVEVTAEIARLERQADGERAQGTLVQDQNRPAAGRRYVELFGAQALSNDGWQSPNEFLAVLHQGLHDTRLRAAATGSVGADGGVAVPTEYFAMWMDASLESEIVRPRAQPWPMTSNTRHVPGWDASSSSSSLYGGFTANWIAQGQEFTEETPKMRAVLLTARKLGLLTQVSNELLADGLGYDSQLSAAIIKALGWFLDRAFLSGNGAGQPLGAINSPVTIVVSKESGQVAATIVYENLVKMFARMHPASIGNSVWVINSTAIPQLLQLSVRFQNAAANDFVGGSHIPVLTESNGQFKILTRPVIFTEKVPALGTQGDVGLYDFSQYAVGMRKEMSLDKSRHPGFTRDTTYYRGIVRGDGQPTWSSVYTPENGDTLSPFVVLETRS